MNIEDNKKIVNAFVERYNSNGMEGVLDLMAETATWWVAGKPGTNPFSGTVSKAQLRENQQKMDQIMQSRIRLMLKGMTAEADRVAAEVESWCEFPDGRVYNNEYHFLFVIKDKKIISIKEYMDTMMVSEFFS